LASDLQAQYIPSRVISSFKLEMATPNEKLMNTWNEIFNSGPPVVFINGMAKANPTVQDVINEYTQPRQEGAR
jgi:hypothetical protein